MSRNRTCGFGSISFVPLIHMDGYRACQALLLCTERSFLNGSCQTAGTNILKSVRWRRVLRLGTKGFSRSLQHGNMAENATRPSLSITTAVIVLLTGSFAMFLGSMWYLKTAYAGSMSQFMLYAHTSPSIAILDSLAILQIVFGLLGIVTSIGLLYLRERARKAAIFLSTSPMILVVFALLIFLAGGNGHGAESMNAGLGFVVCGVELVILLPLSIWWLVLFTRDKVRSQFR
jgi:hypothetical protein